jgi:hypothetical protein
MGFTFHSNGIKMIQRVRFISSALTVTAVSESGGRLKVPHKKRGTNEASSKSIATGKGSIYKNLDRMMNVRTPYLLRVSKLN